MARRHRVAVVALLSVAGFALISMIVIVLTMPSSDSSASQMAGSSGQPVSSGSRPVSTIGPSAVSSSLGTPVSTTRPANHMKTPTAGPPDRIVGVSDPALLGETASQQKADLAAMKAIGINSIRVEADWAQVQADGPSSFDWEALDQTLVSIKAAGMSVDLVIDGCPPWAATSASAGSSAPTPASPSQYATFAAQVAARFAPAGVKVFEIWNEPNIADFWQPTPDPRAYTELLQASYPAIKRAAPSATVISAGLAPAASDATSVSPIDFIEAIYADGGKNYFDALGFHPYSYPAMPDTYESWSAWSQMSQTSPSIRSVMASHGDSGKKIWITEYGAPSSGPDGIGEAAQSASLTQAIDQARATSWIGAIYLYTWVDSGNSPADHGDEFGLLTGSGTQKTAYHGVASALDTSAS
jgi:hypothetical protein